MAYTVSGSFSGYKGNLEITDRQGNLVSSRRTNVVNAINRELYLHTEKSKLTGSYDRSTLTKYLSEGDVDVFVVLHYGENKHWDNPQGSVRALDKFRAILDDAYPNTTKRRDRNCISMLFSEFTLDVVPAFKHDGGYYTIPDSVRQQWIRTDPFKFAEKITNVNKNMDGTFIPLIKMVKGWNRNVGWPIKSFHLECIMHHHYQSYTQSYTYSSTITRFFESLPSYLYGASYDPVTGERVDTYLDNYAALETRRRAAIRKAQNAATASAEAYSYENTDEEKSIRKWKNLMGDFFPSYG